MTAPLPSSLPPASAPSHAALLGERKARALAMLAHSRGRLRTVMLPHERDDEESAGDGRGPLRRLQVLWRYLRRSTRRVPVLQIAGEVVQGWWMAHPWRQVGRALFAPLNDVAGPLMRRHPLRAVALAATAGAVLAAARPWRWTMVTRQARLLRQQATGWMFALITGPAGQALVASLLAGMAVGPAHADDTESTPATPDPDTPDAPPGPGGAGTPSAKPTATQPAFADAP